MTLLRSMLFFVGWTLNTMLCGLACVIAMPLPFRMRHRVSAYWSHSGLKWLSLTCGLKTRVVGLDNLPMRPTVVMSKHQSAWETMALPALLPITTWVTKRELLWIPFFGWGLWALRPIAIDRSKGSEAAQRLVEQGTARLSEGAWIVIFPEGTRIAAGRRGHYKTGGARLACSLSTPIVPVAVNSGEFWPRNGFLKYPGEITLSIGPPIDTLNKTPAQVTNEVEAWIEGEMARISGVGPYWPAGRRPEQVHGHSLAV